MMWACDPVLTASILTSYQAAGPLFAQALQGFLAAQCALVGDHIWPVDAIDAVLQDPHYDFIVVGAGSAGSVVANRLSEIPDWKVLLIEAGGNPTLTTEMPQLFYNNMGSSEDWGYRSEPQNNACLGYKDNRCAWPRGKTLGGCSSINAMFYVRGNKLDYDEWAQNGNKGWSYEEVLPYFKKSENYSGVTKEKTKYHGTGGYLNVDSDEVLHDFEKLILNAAAELGVPILDDVNGNTQMGAAKTSTTTKNGIRQSTARAFLSPIKDRRNLHVIKHAHVMKILFKPNSNVVIGVLINKNGKDITIHARKEVVISAGAINTPQLLQLSGIGRPDHLTKLNIDVISDLPVGDNLQDHPFVPFYYSLPGNTSAASLDIISSELLKYIMTQKGHFSNISPHRILTFYNTKDNHAEIPDIQYHYLVFPPGLYNLVDVLSLHGFKEDIQEKYRKLNQENFVMVIYSVLLRPKSKGKISLKSNNPYEYPLIHANYFDDPDDLKTIMEGFKQHILKLGDTEAFKSAGFKLTWLDLDACKMYDKKSDDFLECYCRHMVFSLYHPTSTAKMGLKEDRTSVVDPELRVNNIENLRVIDASIMPDIVRGNTNAPVIMIAEKGSDFIKKSWLQKHNEL